MEKIQTLKDGICLLVRRFTCGRYHAVHIAASMLCLMLIVTGCSTKKVMEDDNASFEDINKEFGQVVKIQEASSVAKPSSKRGVKAAAQPAPARSSTKSDLISAKPKPEAKYMTTTTSDKKMGKETKHEPALEDGEGFIGRRPIVDPFIEGETAVYSVSYNLFGVEAGELVMQVHPFKVVNGRKAYSFGMGIKSSSKFSLFFALDNNAETNVDYDTFVPLTYSSQTKESSKYKEVRAFYDWTKNEATHWEKTIKKKAPGENKKKIEWSIEPYTQNVISAIYYMRNFVLTPGKKFAFRVADAGKNYVFKGEVLRREKIDSELGELNTVVVRPTFTLDDQYAPSGENLFWLTDDNRKVIVKIQSKIKIGAFVMNIKSLTPALQVK